MNVLILGGTSSFGLKSLSLFSKHFKTYFTFRDFKIVSDILNIDSDVNILDKIDAGLLGTIRNAIELSKPEVVINCIRLTKEIDGQNNQRNMIYINSYFPHLLADICTLYGCKLIHFSTDCVFSGKTGNYKESDFSDAPNLYGKTKYLGEVGYGNHLTIRTSKIGKSVFGNNGLIDWFINEVKKGNEIKGFTNAIYTGFSTTSLCNEIIRLIKNYNDLKGVYHISSNKISKYELLSTLNEELMLNANITKHSDFKCDRSLDSSKYRAETGFVPKSWYDMIKEIKDDE